MKAFTYALALFVASASAQTCPSTATTCVNKTSIATCEGGSWKTQACLPHYDCGTVSGVVACTAHEHADESHSHSASQTHDHSHSGTASHDDHEDHEGHDHEEHDDHSHSASKTQDHAHSGTASHDDHEGHDHEDHEGHDHSSGTPKSDSAKKSSSQGRYSQFQYASIVSSSALAVVAAYFI
ncbi:hypothetical protein BB561_001064 [Smittium simulii]|uniref:Extracellular membrane protein CFEM domain-containing protein n=1 Tax=Smittium simulii TaxID=133385 RepID=A0A2T9YW81_9FUNG|nr:hypothetical protein BB561_001064 [Smittium simulii]